jgi:hypothetical protein
MRQNSIAKRQFESRALLFGCAVLLLFVQSLAAAHFHQTDSHLGYVHDRPAVDLLCAVCLFDLHSPSKPATPVVVPQPVAVDYFVPAAAVEFTPVAPVARPFSRGPPLFV